MEGAGGAWKATNIDGVANNAAMAQGIDNTLGRIGYVEYSYVLIPGNAAIEVAQLQDKNGQWITPSLTNIANAAAAAGTSVTPGQLRHHRRARQRRVALRDVQLGHRAEDHFE